MKKFLLILLFAFLHGGVFAQQFPSLSGTTLEGKTVKIPDNTNGKFTIVGLTNSQKSQQMLSEWTQEIYNYFVMDPAYDLNVYVVPMLGGIKELAAGTVEKEMKKGLDPSFYKHFLLYRGDVAPYRQSLNMTQKEIPYFFVLDKTGKIVYSTSGAYSDDKLEKMEEAMEED